MPVALGIIALGGVIFDAAVIIMAVLMTLEAVEMMHQSQKLPTEQYARTRLYIVSYVVIFAVAMIYLRRMDNGVALVLFISAIVWSTDIAAYFGGKYYGKRKLAPDQPNKTWFGAVSGVIASLCIAMFALIFADNISIVGMVLMAFVLSVMVQLGDLLESYAKRYCDVKDSGTILGYGGVWIEWTGL